MSNRLEMILEVVSHILEGSRGFQRRLRKNFRAAGIKRTGQHVDTPHGIVFTQPPAVEAVDTRTTGDSVKIATGQLDAAKLSGDKSEIKRKENRLISATNLHGSAKARR